MKHIGFGPIKKENQDDFFVSLGSVGGQANANAFFIFDGHGNNGRHVAEACTAYMPPRLSALLEEFFKARRALSWIHCFRCACWGRGL